MDRNATDLAKQCSEPTAALMAKAEDMNKDKMKGMAEDVLRQVMSPGADKQ